MPEQNETTHQVKQYLMGRGIHPSIIDYCLAQRILFESKQYHNAVFIGYDQEGNARYAALRGTMGSFKGEATGSDKHFSFSIPSAQPSERLHLFESAIDLLSYATLAHLSGQDWRKVHLLSLAGVFKTKRENVVPMIPTDPPRRKPPPKSKRRISPAQRAWLDRINGQLAHDEWMQKQREYWLWERPPDKKSE